MSRRLCVVIFAAILAVTAGASTLAQETDTGGFRFYADYESAFLAFNAVREGLTVAIDVSGEVTKAPIKQIDLGPRGLTILHAQGTTFVELRNVFRVWTVAPTYYGPDYRLHVVYHDGRPSVEFRSPNEKAILQAADALATLVAAGGGHLLEFAGFTIADTASSEKQKQTFKWAKSDLKSGVVVSGLGPGSPAERAGFKAGDVLLTVKDVPVWEGFEIQRDSDGNPIIADLAAVPKGDLPRQDVRLNEEGKAVQIGDAFLRYLLSDPSGRVAVKIEVVSGTASKFGRLTRELVLQDLARKYQGPRVPRFVLGMFALPLGAEERGRLGVAANVEGLLITEVNKGGLAERLKLKVDDVLVELNGRSIKTTKDLTDVMVEFDKVESAKVFRGGALVTLTMPKLF